MSFTAHSGLLGLSLFTEAEIRAQRNETTMEVQTSWYLLLISWYAHVASLCAEGILIFR